MCPIVDLSLEIFDKASTFDADPKTEITQFHTIESMGYNIKKLSMSSHLGTHMDAPYHFLAEGKTIDQIDLSKFIGKARIVDFSSKKAGSFIDVEDLIPHREKFTKDARIILRTDWSLEYGKDHFFSHFPQITINAAKWIADKEIGLLGLETPSLNSTDYIPVHQHLLKKQIVIIEALNNVKEIPKEEFKLIALPLRIKHGDGSPVRAVGIVE